MGVWFCACVFLCALLTMRLRFRCFGLGRDAIHVCGNLCVCVSNIFFVFVWTPSFFLGGEFGMQIFLLELG
jgi:hypothetical protein